MENIFDIKKYYEDFTSDEILQLEKQDSTFMEYCGIIDCLNDAEKLLGPVHSFTIHLRQKANNYAHFQIDESLFKKIMDRI